MGFLASELGGEGFATLAPSYGMRRSMTEILEHLAPRVAAFEATLDGPMHIVTHSLGGLVARGLIATHRPSKLGRVVMLAPPNQGSELADLLFDLKLSASILGPVGGVLRTQRLRADAALLGPVDYELGIVAGNVSLTPIPERILPRPHDGKVSVASTLLEGMADHIVVPVPHSLMPVHPASIAQAIAFLGGGRFDHGAVSGGGAGNGAEAGSRPEG